MRLLEYIEQQRISPVEASRQLKVNFSTFYKWTRGKTVPRRTMQLKIMDWSGGNVTPNDFFLSVEARQ